MSRARAAMVGLVCLSVVAVGALIATAVSSSGGGGGPAWSAPTTAPVPSASVGAARAFVDPAGRAHVAWVERHDGRWTLSESVRPPGDDWSAPTTVVRDQAFAIAVTGLAANARGDAAVLWTYAGDHHRQVLMSSVRSAGGSWSTPQALSRPTFGGVGSGGIAMDATGAVTVVGRGLDGPGLWASRREPEKDWTAPARISPAGAGIDAPQLDLAADGRAFVLALLKRHGRPPALWFRQADANGSWGRDAVLPGSDGARLPAAGGGSDGTIVASWVRETPTASRLLAAALPPGGGWARPVTLEGPTDRFVGPPSLLPETQGASVVWPRWDGAPQGRRASIRAQRVAGAGRPGDATTVASLTLAPVAQVPGTIVMYGPAPVQLVPAAGARPAIAWSAATGRGAQDRAAVQVAERDGNGTWSAPRTLSTPGRSAFVLAAGTSADRTVVAWAEGPPRGAASVLLVADR